VTILGRRAKADYASSHSKLFGSDAGARASKRPKNQAFRSVRNILLRIVKPEPSFHHYPALSAPSAQTTENIRVSKLP